MQNVSSREVFNAEAAIQCLHGKLIGLDAIAHAANEAMAELPFPGDREARRPFERVFALISKVADETCHVLRNTDEILDAMSSPSTRTDLVEPEIPS
jgi:hypothetical protein